MAAKLRVVGYAIVSADGMIADAAGRMPPAIINPADQAFFEAALDRVDVLVHGRHSQEQHRNSAQRRRLLLTRSIAALAPHPDNPHALLWNPEGAPLEEACAALGIGEGTVAVIGGTDAFGHFLPRYDAFDLSRAERAYIPGGRPVFPGIPPATPDALLEAHGLHAGPGRVLDAGAGVSLRSWLR